MKLMELNWQKSRYMKTITADECTRSEVRVGTLQTDHFALPKSWNAMPKCCKREFRAASLPQDVAHHPDP